MKTFKTIESKVNSAAILLAALFAFGTVGQAHTNRSLNSNSFTRSIPSSASSVTVSPNAVSFGKVNVGATGNPVTVTIHNGGRGSVTMSNVSLSLLQVTYSGPALPATIAAGQSVQASVRFSPNAAQSYAGMLTFKESNGTTVSAQISGTGVAVTAPAPTPAPTPAPAPAKLTLSSSAVAFGSVTVGASTSQSVTVSNTGSSNLTISGVSLSGAGFNASGVSAGLILTPGQSSLLTVSFDPTATGSVTGSVNIASNVSSAAITLSGSGAAAPVSHNASLGWSIDSGAANGYNVYSAMISGGPYTKLNATPAVSTGYTDSTVQSGKTYYYVVTALNTSNKESGYSNQVTAQIP